MTNHPHDIDAVARAMVDIEPPHDLEARIKHRLDATTQTRSSSWRWPSVAGVAAGLTAAGVLLTLVVQGPTRSTVQGLPEEPVVQGPTGSTVQGSIEVPKSSAPNLGPWTVSNPGPQVSRPIRLPAYRSMSASEWEWISRRVPALERIDPIQPDPVSITPLTMAPLTASPIYGDDGGGQ